MKTLLITNQIEQSRDYICQLIQQAWDEKVGKDERLLNVSLSKQEKNEIRLEADEQLKKDKSKSVYVHNEEIKRNKIKQKKEVKLSFLQDNENFKIISNKATFDTFDFESFLPNVIFIVPELMWENDDVNEGYQIARELITHKYKSQFIQLIFISIITRQVLFNKVDISNKGFVETFPHFSLLDDSGTLKFEYYSEIHFNLIKYLAISEEGRLQKIGHDLIGVKSDIKPEEKDFNVQNKTRLLKQVDELRLFQAYTNESINRIFDEVSQTSTNRDLELWVKKVDDIILGISYKIPKSNKANINQQKSSNRVLIIEDENDYREFFYTIFSDYYTEVYPNKEEEYYSFENGEENYKKFLMSEAKEIVKAQCKNYKIILLDLLYKDKDENGFWLSFNGLDLFKIIRKNNPYAVVRIITSLPRAIVAKVVQMISQETNKPNTDQVFSKKYGKDALKDMIIYEDYLTNINKECEKKDKLRNVHSPYPKKGVFEWPGISNLMEEFLRNQDDVNGDDYQGVINKVNTLFKDYVSGSLSKLTIDWKSGELPKNNRLKELNYDEDKIKKYVKDKLISILVHRLVVLNEAIKNNNIIKYSDFIPILQNITNRATLTDNYFYTCLGFHGTSKDKEVDKNNNTFELELMNLFRHESAFVIQKIADNNDYDKITLSNDAKTLIKAIFDLDAVKNNWRKLNLSFNISGEVSFQNFNSFISSVKDEKNKNFSGDILSEIDAVDFENNNKDCDLTIALIYGLFD